MAIPSYQVPYIAPLGGLDVGAKFGQAIETGIGAYKRKQFEEEAQPILQGGDPNQIADLMLKYPEMQKEIAGLSGYKRTAMSEDLLQTARDILTGTDPRQALSTHIQKAQQAGEDVSRPLTTLGKEVSGKEVDASKNWAMRYLAANDPQGWKELSKIIAPSAAVGTEDIKEWEYYQQLKETDPAQAALFAQKTGILKDTGLTSSQKDYRLAKREGFQGSFMDYKQALSFDPKDNLEVLKLQTQILDIQDRMSDRQAKQETARKLEDKKTKSLVSGIDSIIEEADKAISIAKTSPVLATGITGAAAARVPGSPGYNLRRRLDTVKANLGFDKLQQMRDQSPTGGALGQVSERELNFLQSTLTAIDPSMGDEELIEGLEKVKKHYNNWRGTLTGEMPPEEAEETTEVYAEGDILEDAQGNKVQLINNEWRPI